MYDHTYPTSWKKQFCRYFLHAFSTAEILKRHINDYFNINGKQLITMPKIGEYLD